MKKATAVIAAILMLCCLLSACTKADSLVGTWTVTEDNIEMSFVFNENGTGKITALDGLLNIEYTYEVDGNTVTFQEESDEILGTTPYTFSIEGDKLSITGGGDVMVLTKEK